ncbi:protein of unknown function [Burkholderia multivorans]
MVLPRLQQGAAAHHRSKAARGRRRLPASGGGAFALARRRAQALLRPARHRHQAVHAAPEPPVHQGARRSAARPENRPHTLLAAPAARGDRVARTLLRLSRQLGAQRARARCRPRRSGHARPAALARRGRSRAPHRRVRHLPASGRHLSRTLPAHGVRDRAAALLHHGGREVHAPARSGRGPLSGLHARMVARFAARPPAVVLEGDRRGAALFPAGLHAARRRLDRAGARIPRALAGRAGGGARGELGGGEAVVTGRCAASHRFATGARQRAIRGTTDARVHEMRTIAASFPQEVPRWP